MRLNTLAFADASWESLSRVDHCQQRISRNLKVTILIKVVVTSGFGQSRNYLGDWKWQTTFGGIGISLDTKASPGLAHV